MSIFCPANTDEVAEIVASAAAEGRSLEIVGAGSKRFLGRAERPADQLATSAIAGIVDYDPAELVLTARAGTPIAEIEALLEANQQMLAFEPAAWHGLAGGGAEPTLGGTLACNLSGPRRVRAGAARDHVLGFSAVNGRGEQWRAGGRVVKNVTGYDMCKLLAGSYGTLSVLTEICVRVLPKPETSCSIVVLAQTADDAVRTMATALNSEHEVSAAAFVPAEVSRLQHQGEAVLRIEGHAPSVNFRAAALERHFPGAARLGEAASERFWRTISAVHPLLGDADDIIWKVNVPASAAVGLIREVQHAIAGVRGFLDWGGSLLWIAIPQDEAGEDGGMKAVRTAVASTGGHATLIRAAAPVRARIDPFHPQAPALAALSARIKTGFDPHGVLNPGRMYEGV